MMRLPKKGSQCGVTRDGESISFSSGSQERGVRQNRASDRMKPAGTEHGLRDTSECSAQTLGTAQPVGSTILELNWTADMDSYGTAQVLLPGRRHLKHADSDREQEMF
jgi:hypothetical protein